MASFLIYQNPSVFWSKNWCFDKDSFLCDGVFSFVKKVVEVAWAQSWIEGHHLWWFGYVFDAFKVCFLPILAYNSETELIHVMEVVHDRVYCVFIETVLGRWTWWRLAFNLLFFSHASPSLISNYEVNVYFVYMYVYHTH